MAKRKVMSLAPFRQINVIPQFSVILPTYNREHLLGRAIASVQAQILKNWELIIVDDGSSDSTPALVRDLMKQDSRIKYVYQKNQGAATARNLGISQARGSYIAFLDSDDQLKANHLSSRYDLFRGDPELDMVYGAAEIVGDNRVVSFDNPKQILSLDHPDVRIGGTFTLKTESLIRIGGFPLVSYGEDFCLFNRAQQSSLKIAQSLLATYCYDRTHSDSTTMKMLDQVAA